MSIFCDLNYLDDEVSGSSSHKFSSADCYIKSVNILVKEDLTCVIADLGEAPGPMDCPSAANVGTIVYVSPEVFNC